MKNLHLHLVSDATGETINNVARACLVQFPEVEPIEHTWSMVRSERQMRKVLDGIAANPGLVLFTFVDDNMRGMLEEGCRGLTVPCIAVLDPVLGALAGFFHMQARHIPGRQHALDSEYFARIEAMNFVMAHDDGQMTRDLEKADVVLLGVSRTSKTPTSLYLANRGIKAANVPIVPGVPPPEELETLKSPLIVGLTCDPASLVQVRRNRLRMINDTEDTSYTDMDTVRSEVTAARQLYARLGVPVLDVSRRSIEETAAAIMQMIAERKEIPAS
jgi:[pyruvate, water dikinase]-phosphate phosphotransferase / [pyruvate, water dikinase] kinase